MKKLSRLFNNPSLRISLHLAAAYLLLKEKTSRRSN